LEDRVVKDFMRTECRDYDLPAGAAEDLPHLRIPRAPRAFLVERKPLRPSLREIEMNPRSRSAQLRVFVELPVEATMELCKRMEQKMVKRLQDAKEVHPAKEQASDGLGGYTASYTGSVDGRQANMTVILFKDGKNRSILGVVFMADHATMPKEQNEKLEAFMKSLKSTAK
ncbi:MAG: 16S rRNA (cytosine(1402)-N(4))-methyltransferase, partial [Verrucomicrobia bacterium]|nr:16S rRNA (cytosine(1402)-N(4))-methyltransferase [Verrucomicrobiota bacterium]